MEQDVRVQSWTCSKEITFLIRSLVSSSVKGDNDVFLTSLT